MAENPVEIGAITEALNSKVDTDVGNTNATGNAVIANYAFPSSYFEDMTLLASGQTYTAPADGWFCLRITATAAGQFAGLRTSIKVVEERYSTSNSDVLSMMFPAAKGTSVEARYNAGGSVTAFGFLYAKGSEPQS